MKTDIVVGISDLKIHKGEGRLVTYALGSCIGICVHDSVTKISGLSHILLPEAKPSANGTVETMKYADTAIPELIKQMERMGANRRNMQAKIFGGAQMFKTANAGMTVGQRNIAAVREALKKEKISIVAEDTGADYGRTIFMDSATGKVQVKTAFGHLSEH